MKVTTISDLHDKIMWLNVEKCDLFICCGDFHIHSESALSYVLYWLNKQYADDIIYVAGNHDTYLEKLGKDECIDRFENIIYLENDIVEINGLTIYGSPFTPEFNNWAFMRNRGSADLKNIWKKIPYNLDILVTHGPAYGILDKNLNNEHCGCEILQKEIFEKKPKYHFFGHIHGEYGQETRQNVHFCNCSLLNEEYKLKNNPIIFEF